MKTATEFLPQGITAQYRFRSITEFGDYVKRNATADAVRKSHRTSRDETGGMAYDDAIEAALAGGRWDAGTKAVAAAALELDAMPRRPRTVFKSAVAGSRVYMPGYCAGSPRAMLRATRRPSQKRVVRLAVHVGRQWEVEQREAVNRGAAILRTIEAAEFDGITQIEVWAVWRNADGRCTGSIETLIKPAGVPYAADDLAFALCHLAFQRRLCWTLARSTPELKLLWGNMGHGAGQTFPDYDLHIPYMTPQNSWSTVAGAVNEIARQCSKITSATAGAA